MKRWGRLIPNVPNYTVTERGEVFSHYGGRARQLRPYTHHHGHQRLQVRIDGKPRSIFVHVAVALAWIGPPPFDGAKVLHGDGNPRNNTLANLRYGTLAENVADMRAHGTMLVGERGTSAKLTAAQVIEARQRRAQEKVSIRALARELSVDPKTVRRFLTGRSWVHLGE